jgi:hypothetical protein
MIDINLEDLIGFIWVYIGLYGFIYGFTWVYGFIYGFIYGLYMGLYMSIYSFLRKFIGELLGFSCNPMGFTGILIGFRTVSPPKNEDFASKHVDWMGTDLWDNLQEPTIQ